MTRRTRWFLLGSALIVVAGLCTGLVAYYNGALPLLGSGPGPAELAYVPETATIVAFANVGQIMKSDVRKRLQEALPSGENNHVSEGRDELKSQFGIDIEHDIDTVVAGFGMANGEQGTSTTASDQKDQKADPHAIVLVRGRFDQPRIEAAAKDHGAETEEYKGKQILESQSSSGNTHAGALAFLEPGLLALGTLNAVKDAIDTRGDGQSIRKNSQLMKFVANVDPTSNAWVAGSMESLTKNANLPAAAKDRLAAVQWFSVTARVDGGISGMIRAEARDEQAGEDLRSVVRGGLAAARLMSGQNAKIDLAINSLQLSGSGKDVDLAFTVPPDLLDVANGIAGLKNLTTGGH